MFQDVDETLRALLMADVPIKKAEVDIAFERPTRDWSSRLSKPTLNLFLFDVRERADLKDDVPIITRDSGGGGGGKAPPRPPGVFFFVRGWTTQPRDENPTLSPVAASL